jgi:voltage-gated potassium channel
MNKKAKEKLYDVIYEAETPSGRIFDILLLVLILISVLAVTLESVTSIRLKFATELKTLEWIITIIFTIEYMVRIWIINRSVKYIFSFYGIIDFLAIIPTYLALFIAGTQSLIIIRALRLLRVFRILKITRYTREGKILIQALIASRVKISVFLFGVVTIILIIGTIMYLVEGEPNGFDNIPKSIYWAVVTLTTVGYGDITPQTPLGQLISGFVMILGYAIIAVPTGIVSVEISNEVRRAKQERVCSKCGLNNHDEDARYCKRCGQEL